MAFGEQLFLGMVVALFTSFAILFGTLTWLDARYGKKLEAEAAAGTRQETRRLAA